MEAKYLEKSCRERQVVWGSARISQRNEGEKALIPDGYDLVGDEYVRKIPTMVAAKIERQIEVNAPLFFNRIGSKKALC
jgi:hypothetical protein